MTVTFRPAARTNTPLIVGISGPTKSGKTLSALRLATGMADGAPVAMINTEGPKGHQYAGKFDYMAADLQAPFRPQTYADALKTALRLQPKPRVVVIDSLSHMHDGPGGILEWHEEELDRRAGSDWKKRERTTFAAWIKPKQAENQFIYAMLEADCHLILCFRAKEKMKIVPGHEPVPLGWQPIAGDRIAFETLFTLVLPPFSKGVPDLSVSQMREPFDDLIPATQQLSEETGRRLAEWATGAPERPQEPRAAAQPDDRKVLTAVLLDAAEALGKREGFARAINANRAEHSTEMWKHVEWLKRQVDLLEKAS